MRIALYQPDIPQNTGTILRLCACLGVEAHLIGPAGFPTSDRAFRRAGMDYLDAVSIVRHRSWREFETWRRTDRYRLVLFTTTGALPYLEHRIEATTSCCSDANRQACRPRCMRPPTPAWSFQCAPACAR
jgi:tRNA (cytidine/uridine-2'-O-)-methyltransferase